MRTVEIKLYQFNELSESAKQKVISDLWDINVDHNWWGSTYEDASNIGIVITSFDIDRHQIEAESKFRAEYVAEKIIETHGEDCDTYKLATKFLAEYKPIIQELENDDCENWGDLDEKREDLESEFLSDISEQYLSILSEEYNYRTSEEQIIETIESNEYEFTENGKLF